MDGCTKKNHRLQTYAYDRVRSPVSYWQSQYYIDLYLPLGLRSAPFLFDQISDALEWILKHNYGLCHVIHILDDFFSAVTTKFDCLGSFTTLLKVFMSLRVPTIASKTLGPSQVLEFIALYWTVTARKRDCLKISLPGYGNYWTLLPTAVLPTF